MESTPSSTQSDPHHGEFAAVATQDRWSGVEDALATLAQRSPRDLADPPTRTEALDTCADPQVGAPAAAPDVAAPAQVDAPSVLAAVRPAEFRNDPLASERPSVSRRAIRAVARFAIAICIGVAGSLAWQAYGDAAKQMIANRVPQLAWISSRAAASQPPGPAATTGLTAPGPAIEASAPQPPAAQAAPVAPIAPQPAVANVPAPAAPAAPPPDQQQLDGMARDLGALRQSVEQLTARQEQMARDMAKLQAVKPASHRVLGTPPHPLGVLRTAPPAAPQVSATAPSAQPYPQPAPQISPQPAVTAQSLRPPVPVPEH